jgi:hypothetical protein
MIMMMLIVIDGDLSGPVPPLLVREWIDPSPKLSPCDSDQQFEYAYLLLLLLLRPILEALAV